MTQSPSNQKLQPARSPGSRPDQPQPQQQWDPEEEGRLELEAWRKRSSGSAVGRSPKPLGASGPAQIGGEHFVPGPIGKIHDVAEDYMRTTGPNQLRATTELDRLSRALEGRRAGLRGNAAYTQRSGHQGVV